MKTKKKFLDFLKKVSREKDQPAAVNMYDEQWESKTNTLMYILEKADRFKKNGMFQVLFDSDEVIACSGIYKSAFCDQLAIGGTRTWIDKNYRNLSLSREYLLTREKQWAIENKFKAIALCFNDYNKNRIS